MGAKEDLSIIVRAGTEQLASDLARGAAMLRTFAKSVERDSPKSTAIDAAAGSLSKASKAASEAKMSFSGATMSIGSFAGKAAIAGGVLIALEAGFTGVSGAIQLVKSSINMAADVEQNTIAFETMLGSAEKAAEVMQDLRRFAAETPFSNKEVTESARQLLAYGVAADQLIPTLKLVGTLSAGVSKPLGETVYKYGTTKTQGVAHQIDINQLTNAGIDVIPSIAKELKIPTEQVRKFVEDGRVDFKVYQAALVDLANTRFSGMLEKQAKSLKGGFEQLGDAWDIVKLKLGQTIVRESGLKAELKNLEAFSKTVGRVLDSPEFGSGVRFVADLAKATANLAYQFGRVAVNVSSVGFEAIGRAFPVVKETADSLNRLVQDAKNFHIDEDALASAALNVAEALVMGMAEFADWAAKNGKIIKTDLIDPLTEVVKRLAQISALSKPQNMMAAWNVAILKEFGLFDDKSVPGGAAGAAKAAAGGAPATPAPPAMTDAEILAQWKTLRTEWKTAEDLPVDHRDRAFARATAEFKTHQFLKQFGVNGSNRDDFEAMLDKGKIPGRIATVLPPPKVEPAPVGFAGEAREFLKTFRGEVMGRAADAKRDRIERQLGEAGTELKQLAAVAALGPYGALMPAINASKEARLQPDNNIPPHLIEAANKLNEKFNPGDQLTKTLGDMKEQLVRGLISPDVFTKGRDNAIRETAERLGLAGETKLASGALVGSAEDARLLAQFRSGQSQQTTDDLLRLILDEMRKNTRGTGAVSDAIGAAFAGVANITP